MITPIIKRSGILIYAGIIAMSFYGCNGNSPRQKAEESYKTEGEKAVVNKGVGPVSEVKLGPLDTQMAEEGKQIFDKMCTACHKPKEKFIGPAPAGILERRSPEWIMNMILNPEKMVVQDTTAKRLLMEYNLAPMANQGLTEEEARKILEYFRTIE